MPILDWTRTDLDFPMPDGSTGLRFDATEFAAFELYLLQRSGAAQLYTDEQKQQAKARLDSMTDEQVNRLTRTIIAGLPGSEETYTIEQFRSALDDNKAIDDQALRYHLYAFLREVIPVADSVGIRLAIHPDDPPTRFLAYHAS